MTDDDMFADEEFDNDGDAEDLDTEDESEELEPEFESVYQFVEEHLVHVYARHMQHKPGRLWCPRWFVHAEAVSRLEALWRAYESLRLDPATGMSVWWRDHVDHHMRVLMAPDGPFEGCGGEAGHKRPAPPLPVEPMTDVDLREAMSTTDPESDE